MLDNIGEAGTLALEPGGEQMFFKKRPQGTVPPLPPPIVEQLKVAFTRYVQGDYEGASNEFSKIAALAPQAGYDRATGWSLLCHAIHLMLNEGDRIGAELKFRYAYENLEKAKDFLGMKRAEVGFHICQGQMHSSNHDFEDAVTQYINAKSILSAIKDRLPLEAAFIQRISLGLDYDIACCKYMDELTDGDYDSARLHHAKIQDAHNELLKILPDAESKTYYQSVTRLVEGVRPLLQAGDEVPRFALDDAAKHLDEAMPILKAVTESLAPLEGRLKRWRNSSRVAQAALLQCQAAKAQCRALKLVLDGNRFAAIPHLREAAKLHDEASVKCAGAGLLGIEGHYSSSGVRDSLNGLATAIESLIEKDLAAKLDFKVLAIDQKLAAILERDYQEVLDAFYAGAWKLCMTGAGGIIEAMLVDRLQANWAQVVKACGLDPRTTPAQLKDWVLAMMIERAEKASILTPGNMYLSDALRDYRNLIHPLKDALGKHVIDRDAALGSLRALLSVIGSLK